MPVSLLDKWRLMQAALCDPALSPAAKVVFGRLLSHLNTMTGQCTPSFETLAKAASTSRRSAIRNVNELRQAGWILRDSVLRDGSRSHLSNSFRFDFTRAAEADEVVTGLSPPEVGGSAKPDTTLVTGLSPGVVTGLSPKYGKKNTGKEHGKTPPTPSRFNEWWSAYPRKAGKDHARPVFDRIVASGKATADELIAGAERFAAERADEDPKYTPYPATWLNGGCWSDEPAPRHAPRSASEPFVEAGVEPNVTELAVAVLFDSRARQPENGPAYVSTLTDDLIDLKFPSAAVVAACQELRRTSKFMPEIAEVISACERHAKNYAATLSLARRALERRADIELLLVEDRARQRPQPPSPAPPPAADEW